MDSESSGRAGFSDYSIPLDRLLHLILYRIKARMVESRRKARMYILRREREFFARRLPSLLQGHSGEYVVIKGHEIIGFYTDPRTAYRAGAAKFGLEPFFMAQI